MNFDEKIKQLHLERQLKLEDLPQVDLYMDQVIQLFQNVYGEIITLRENYYFQFKIKNTLMNI